MKVKKILIERKNSFGDREYSVKIIFTYGFFKDIFRRKTRYLAYSQSVGYYLTKIDYWAKWFNSKKEIIKVLDDAILDFINTKK